MAVRRSVWKYELRMTDAQTVGMPESAQLLSVDIQNGKLCLWALVAVDFKARVNRKIIIHGTGHPVSDSIGAFVGTVLMDSGALVFHVFDGGVV